jgi:membrane protein implicated in regulation of membrane protease activity
MTLPAPPVGRSSPAWEIKFFAFAALAILLAVFFVHGSSLWDWYGQNRDKVAPLFVPVANVFGALATLGVGVFLVRAALAQAATARLRHEAQTESDLQRRITESYLKAVEQLGSDKIEVRLGGIYTLERISRESPDDSGRSWKRCVRSFVSGRGGRSPMGIHRRRSPAMLRLAQSHQRTSPQYWLL